MPAANPFANLPVSKFDATAAEVLRRRKLAQALQEQSLASPGEVPITHRVSVLNPLAKMAQALAGVYMNKQAGEDEGNLSAAREQAFQTAMEQMPRGTPEQVGTGPIAPDQGEFLPNVAAKLPTPEEMLAWSGKVRGTTATGDEIGKLAATNALTQMLPKNPMDQWKATPGGDLYTIGPDGKPQFVTSPMTQAKFDEAKATQAANLQAKADALAARMEQAGLDRESREAMARERNDLLRELGRMRADIAAAGKGEVGTWTTEGIDANGNTVRINSKTNERVVLGPDGKPVSGVQGSIMPRNLAEKDAGAYRAASGALKAHDDLTKELQEVDTGMTGTKGTGIRVATALGLGGAARSALLTPEQIKTQAKLSLKVSTVMKELFGAAQSMGESARAAGFEIKEDDPLEVKIGKMNGLRSYLESKMAGISEQGRALGGGGGTAPAGGTDLASKYGI